MNFSLPKASRASAVLTVLLVLACSCQRSQAGAVAPHRQKRGFGLSDIFNDVKDTWNDLFGSEEGTTTTTSTTTTSTSTTTTTTTASPASSESKLNDTQCRALLTECGLVDVSSPGFRDSLVEETEAIVKAQVDKVREQYRVALEEIKKTLVFLIDITIKDPSRLPLSHLCDTVHTGEEGKTTVSPPNGPTTGATTAGTDATNAPTKRPQPTATPSPATTTTSRGSTKTPPADRSPSTSTGEKPVTTLDPDNSPDDSATTPTTTKASITTVDAAAATTPTTPKPTTTTATPATTLPSRCVVGQWSDWSAPLGFGTQERTREILQPGSVCPELLKEYRNFTVTTTTASPNGDDGKTTDGYYTDGNDNDGGDIDNNGPKTTLNPIDDTDLVSDNFGNDFMRPSEGKPRDLLLILDSSGSIDKDEFAAIRSGVSILINTLCGGFGPAPEQNRLAIIQYSSTVRSVLSFSPRHQNARILKYLVDRLQPMNGYTCTGDALNMGYMNFQEIYGARNYSVHDTLIITDGQSNCGANLLNSSRTLQERSNVYALAIGMSSDEAAAHEITSLVSNRDPRHLFSLANFQDFKVMAEKVKAKQEAAKCQPIVISNTTTTATN